MKQGDSATVAQVTGCCATLTQLKNMGVIPGQHIKILNKSHLTLLAIGNTTLGLSSDIIHQISVYPLN